MFASAACHYVLFDGQEKENIFFVFSSALDTDDVIYGRAATFLHFTAVKTELI